MDPAELFRVQESFVANLRRAVALGAAFYSIGVVHKPYLSAPPSGSMPDFKQSLVG